MNPKAVIQKWYDTIGFPACYDAEFHAALERYAIDPAMTPMAYGTDCTDGKKNFLYYLYFCERLQKQYRKAGIDDAIFLDTVSDIRLWLKTWSDVKGTLYLGEIHWLIYHFTMQLFKIGRLEYRMAKAECEIPERGITTKDNVVEIHIPAAGPLLQAECEQSVDAARAFMEKFYPEYHYSYFMCGSWLLDEGLAQYLDKDSNMIRFQKLFDIPKRVESDSILMFTLGVNINRENVNEAAAKTGFAQKVKELAMQGETFYAGYGLIKK